MQLHVTKWTQQQIEQIYPLNNPQVKCMAHTDEQVYRRKDLPLETEFRPKVQRQVNSESKMNENIQRWRQRNAAASW